MFLFHITQLHWFIITTIFNRGSKHGAFSTEPSLLTSGRNHCSGYEVHLSVSSFMGQGDLWSWHPTDAQNTANLTTWRALRPHFNITSVTEDKYEHEALYHPASINYLWATTRIRAIGKHSIYVCVYTSLKCWMNASSFSGCWSRWAVDFWVYANSPRGWWLGFDVEDGALATGMCSCPVFGSKGAKPLQLKLHSWRFFNQSDNS